MFFTLFLFALQSFLLGLAW